MGPDTMVSRRQELELAQDRLGIFFLIALLGGVVSLIVAQIMGSVVLAVVLPTAFLLAYIVGGYLGGLAKPMMEQFADSAYYMGFLLTLVALSASLYAFDSDDIDLAKLVHNFALALITTILGLTARLFFINFLSDTQTTRLAIRKELHEATNRVTREARKIGMRLEQANVDIHAGIEEALKTTRDSLDKASHAMDTHADSVRESIETIGSEASKGILRILGELRSKINEIELPNDLFIQKLEEPISQFVDRLGVTETLLTELNAHQKSFTNETGTIAKRLGGLNEKLEGFGTSLNAFNESLKSQARTDQDLSQLLSQVADTSTQAKVALEYFSQQAKVAEELTKSFENAGEKVVVASEAFQAGAERVALGTIELEETTRTVSRSLGEIGELTEDLANLNEIGKKVIATSQQVGASAEAFAKLGEQVQGLGAFAERHIKHLRDLDNEYQVQLDMVRSHQEGLKALLENSRETTSKVHQQFVDAAEYIKSRLG